MKIIVGQGTYMVLLEVVSAHSPVAFLTEGPALCFATFREQFLCLFFFDYDMSPFTVDIN